MKNPKKTKTTTLTFATLLAVGLLFAATPGEAAAPPLGRTYFVLSLGVATDGGEAYEIDAGCLTFTRTAVCETDGDCGSWWRIDEETRLPRQSVAGFEFDLTDDETGLPVRIEGRGRIDARGPKSSLAAVGYGIETASGTTINFAIAGRSVGAQKCRRLVREFEEERAEARGGRS